MKRAWFWGILILSSLLITARLWAFPVNPVGVYWDIQSAYGDIYGTIDNNSSSYLTPSLPHEYTVPESDYVEVYDDDGNFYAYASYDADIDYLSARAYGFADDPDYDHGWYFASAKVAIASNPFSGASLFTLSFDWFYGLDLTDQSSGKVGYAVGLIDWTETNDPDNPVFLHQETVFFTEGGSESGYYENSWVLDPTHEYIFGVGLLALAQGAEDAEGADAFIEITNLSANAVPEPASILLVGAGLGMAFWFQRRSKQ